ncbi:17-beta-hydroxysteroid dehydrogenase type 2 [Sphaeramia orbicularis]|uniref:Estradiol 17-beta-dehydrogenase 2-like n=1 Tax=Sphaeramia orbicularis TaxID=375764 RepID=A0A672ZQ78_9TELE|nr:estradiol 17-beta-dehydrogenase 2-like [Sphaeramia orbicularis]
MWGCMCVGVAAVYISTVVWKCKEGSVVGYWAAASVAFGSGLYFVLSPVWCGVSLLCCSLGLHCLTLRMKQMLPPQGKAVLVTGCDTGFGHAVAKQLSEMGVQVFAGVLDVNGPGAQELKERGSENLHVLQLDVTDSSQIEQAHQHIRSQVGRTGLWGLVNNAGILQCPVDAELHPFSGYRRLMEVNFLAAVKMCQVFLPLLRRSRGRIVNVSSLAGDVPIPTFAAYGASKAALSTFSRVMRLELAEWGVRVSIIQPTGFRTNIYGVSGDTLRFRDEILRDISPETREDYGEAYISSFSTNLSKMPQQLPDNLSPVVDDICDALLSIQPKPLYMPGQMGWLLPFLHRHCPTSVLDVLIINLIKHTNCKPAGLRSN